MTRNGFITFFVITVLALALTIFSVMRQPVVRSSDLIGAPIFPGLTQRLNGLKTVVIRSGEGEINLDYDGNKAWTVRERENYPADASKVAGLVVQIAQMERLEPKTRLPEKYDLLGVGDPKVKGNDAKEIVLLNKDGRALASLIMGKRKFALGRKESGTYIRLPNDPQTWLALADVDVDTNPGDWLSQQIVAIPDSAIKRVSLTHPDGGKVVVEKREPTDANFEIDNIPSGQEPASPNVANEFASVLADLTFDDMVKADTVTFAKDKTTVAEFEGFEGSVLTIETTEKDGKTWLRVRNATASNPKSAIADLAVRSQGWVYQVPAYKVGALKKKLSDLVKKPGKDSRS